MKVTVRQCYGGHEHFYFKLSAVVNDRLCVTEVTGNQWNRKLASYARDRVSQEFNIKRSNIEFVF